MVSKIISHERLGKYLTNAGFNEEKALALYGWNIQISEAFFPVLSASEVCLRNTISRRLTSLYGDQWWDHNTFIEQMNKRGKGIVRRARDKLSREGKLSSGGMTAELSFGFWVNMLLRKYEDAIWVDFRTIFPNLPDHVNYEALYERCSSVSKFRNRVFHHEPIIEYDISKEYSQIIELIKWLSPEKAEWIKKYSRTMQVLRDKPK